MRYLFILLLTCAIIVSSCTGENNNDNGKLAGPVPSTETLVERGRYLVTIGGCNDCHSPKKMGPHGPEVIAETMLSGYPSGRPLAKFDTSLAKRGIAQFNEDMTAAAGPWGVSFAGNLTSDATGAGSWPLENFKTALRHGKFKGVETGRNLLPPMPWFNYAKMSDDDIEAIHAYLKSTKPVSNVPPAPRQLDDIK